MRNSQKKYFISKQSINNFCPCLSLREMHKQEGKPESLNPLKLELSAQKKRSWNSQRINKKGVSSNNILGRQLVNNFGAKSKVTKSLSQSRSKSKQNGINRKDLNSGFKVLSLSQLLARLRQKRQEKVDQQKRRTPLKPIIPPKAFVIILTEKPKKIVYNRRIIDYKHCGLLQRYLGLGGKILPRRQTRLTAKQQRFVAKAIKSARIMGLLPFVSKERGFFR